MAITATSTPRGFLVTGTTDTADDITDSRVKLNSLTWERPTTQGHLLTVTDKNGTEIHTFYCDNDNESLSEEFYGKWYDGLYVSDMDSGTLHVDIA